MPPILIIPDTNFFHNDEQEDLCIHQLNLNSYYNLLNAIKFRKFDNELFIGIPELVLCELISHHKKDLQKVLQKGVFENKLKNISIADIINLDFDEYCKLLRNKYINKLDIIIEIPEDKERLFNYIFKRALDKVPPFRKKSDPGFKDTILFLSILYFTKRIDINRYILVTNDTGFTDKKQLLENEFKEFCKDSTRSISLNICTKRDFFNWLDEEYGIFENLTNYIENNFFDHVLNNYRWNSIIMWINDYLDILEFSLIKEDTEIYFHDGKYEVVIYISIWINRSNDRVEGIFYDKDDEYNITQKEVYIFEKINKQWNYELVNSRYEVLYDEWDESFMYDEYPPLVKK